MRGIKTVVILMVSLWCLSGLAIAQVATLRVPDLTGMTAPQAASTLHLLGLRLGSTTIDLSPTAHFELLGTVTSQSIIAGEEIGIGESIDITILQAPNIRFVYDDNDLTFINQTGRIILLEPLVFVGNGEIQKTLTGTRWNITAIPAGGCVQIWSIGRTAPKNIDGCSEISAWFSTTDASTYFWTQAAAIERFTVQQAGETLSNCPAAPLNSQDAPMSCVMYLPTIPSPDQSRFLYLSYTSDALVIYNPMADIWMSLVNQVILPDGSTIDVSDVALYQTALAVSLTTDGTTLLPLSPNECVVFRTTDDTPLPEDCGLIVAEQTNAAPFWLTDFSIMDNTGTSRICKAAVADKTTVCVVQQ